MSQATDPFAALDDEEQEVGTLEGEAVPPKEVPAGSLFVFDLETVPDETRFPRPVKQEASEKPDAAIDLVKLAEGTVQKISGVLGLLSGKQLAALADIETGGKNRSGVIKAITDQQQANGGNFEAEFAEWKKLSFNPFGLRIVALGIEAARGHSVTMVAKSIDEERDLLNCLWTHIAKFGQRCGYNITAFDDAALIFRSMILGIDASQKLNRKKFGDKASIDLMTALFPAGNPQKLKEVCRMLGIVPLAGYEMSGDKVFDLVEAGDWDGIANYVHSDAVIEFELYNRLADYVLF